ncbi:hypothetical protein KC320_g73 [Hortaea werneckii]|nr:hypothetical protein KC320_g73 [Hortaea werneckii]
MSGWNAKDGFLNSRWCTPTLMSSASNHVSSPARALRTLRSATGFLSCQAALSSPFMTKRRVAAACVDGAETLCRKRRRLAALRSFGSTGPRDPERDERDKCSADW